MRNRWYILALLFAVRTAMAFQFQAVAALAPLLERDFGMSIADVGFLIGLYLAPGLALALPGGAVGHRFGDKRAVCAGLALMTLGGLLMAASPDWSLQVIGRLLSGVGGIVLNVLMSKMVTDWFADREIATAMAIFVNSWPFGIAVALVVLPLVATATSVAVAYLLTAALSALGLIALALFYRVPVAAPANTRDKAGAIPAGSVLAAVILAGLVWGLFNGGLSMIFGFGPSMLAERGWAVAQASSTTSIVLWLLVLSVPLGGFLADRTRSPGIVLVIGLLAQAFMLVVAARVHAIAVAFTVMGLVSGLPAGPCMSLPARVLSPSTRAIGMGVFYTASYAIMVSAPWLGGIIAHAAGTARTTFDFGAGLAITAILMAWLFFVLARGAKESGSRTNP